MVSRIRIGTSGWVYPHWKGRFYPDDLRADDRLAYYAGRFDTVELNNSFYGLPKPAALKRWRETVPKGFLFAAKASRYITHRKKLHVEKASLTKFFRAVGPLEEKLGPILFQLPPHWGCDAERLSSFLRKLPTGFRYTFEFRDPSWWNEEVYDLLRRHRAAWCIFDLAGKLCPVEVTADFVYVRLHGPASQAYRGNYGLAVLRKWASRIEAWRKARKRVYVYFDNDEKAFAAADALRLKDLAIG